MGVFCNTKNAYTILPLFLVLFITPSSSFSPSDIVTKELLSKLCSQTSTFNARFCITWLTADPRTTTLTVHGLTELIVNKSLSFGQKNLAMLKDFARASGNEKELKKAYESCVTNYGITIKSLESAKEFLRNSSFEAAFSATRKVIEYVSFCKDQFDGPSNEPQVVIQREDRFFRMCLTALGFAGLLT